MKDYDYQESEDNYDMAVEWIRNKDPEKAVECLKKTIMLNPRFTYAYITMAQALGMMKDFSQAINILKKAAKIDPDFDRLNFLMAKYAYKAGNYPKALKYIKEAMEKSPRPLYKKSREVIIKSIKRLK